ncbi:MAG: NAD-dependent epimerase/dehydratase family protein [Candidatus Levybacteria bacterium]|nr:NAD-dependent epimerase/dehydratase family protein [Candidatus Levybacteria bacterium]
MNKPKVIVTGGAGFIGTHLVNYLLKNDYNVLVIDNLSSGSFSNVNSKAEFKNIDVRNTEKIFSCFKAFSPNYVFHLAAITSKFIRHSKEIEEINSLGTINILDASMKSKVRKIIFSSSAAVYGETTNLPIKEDHKVMPKSSYGISKVGAENYILLYSKNLGLNYAILRYSNVYGPGQRSDNEGGVVSIFCEKIKNLEQIEIYGDGNQTRDFVYVEDLVRANLSAMIYQNNLISNVSSGKETKIIELANIIQKVSGNNVPAILEPARPGEIIRSCLNNIFIEKEMGWRPTTTLEQGIIKTYESYKT